LRHSDFWRTLKKKRDAVALFSKARCLSVALTAVALGLAGCGGSGGGGGGGGGGETPTPTPPPPPPPPANRAPVFTSASTASIAEDAGAGTVFYTATATDADNDPITFSIVGGEDRTRLQISAAGGLSFVLPPDFENPADIDRNNIYLVEISASDGKTSTTLTLSVTVLDDGRYSIDNPRLSLATSPIAFVPVPDHPSDVYALETTGRVFRMSDGGTRRATYQVQTPNTAVALGIAFGPGGFYQFAVTPNRELEVRRFAQPDILGNLNNVDVILRIPHPDFDNNNGGFIAFGPDGFLYVGTGDGGGTNDPNNNAQNASILLGKLLRIDVTQDAFPNDPLRDYAIPAGNPFAAGGGAPEVFALGLRDPFKGAFDGPTGNLYIGDRQPQGTQEINLVRPSDRGANFGWPFRQGSQVLRAGGPAAPLPPVIEFEGTGVIGGFVYRGGFGPLMGRYLFGDGDGRVWAVPAGGLMQGSTVTMASFTQLLQPSDFSPPSLRCFGFDTTGNNVHLCGQTRGYTLEALRAARPSKPSRSLSAARIRIRC
jgi:glucose/arabinose dehydrogenase